MKQIDWIEELEEKKKRWYYRKYLEEKSSDERRFEWQCSACGRHIIVDLIVDFDSRTRLTCYCGKDFTLGAEIKKVWIEQDNASKKYKRGIYL